MKFCNNEQKVYFMFCNNHSIKNISIRIKTINIIMNV